MRVIKHPGHTCRGFSSVLFFRTGVWQKSSRCQVKEARSTWWTWWRNSTWLSLSPCQLQWAWQQCWIQMKTVRLLIKGGKGAWLAPSCTSQGHGWTFSSLCDCVHTFKLPHSLHIGQPFYGFSSISNTHSNLGFVIPHLHCMILLAVLILISWVVGLTEKALLVHVIFLDLLLFLGLLANDLLLHNPPQRPSM
jgi:hypothetical protein